MKLGTLLIVASLLIGSAAYGQMTDCERFLGVANNAYAQENFPEAIEYYKKVEAECEELGKDNYDRLVASYIALMDKEEFGGDAWLDKLEKVMATWEVMDEKGFYNKEDDLTRGYYYSNMRTPDYAQADKYLARGIRAAGTDLYDENYITLFYFNTYTMWYIELDEAKKAELKQRLIKDYFEMSKLIKDANFAPSIQEGLTGYLGQVITSCEDLQPEIPVFIESLPEDPESKKTALMNMAKLMKDNECLETDEYKNIADMLYKLDPEDEEIQIIVLETKSYSEQIPILKELKAQAETDEEKNKYQYKIAYNYSEMNQYKAAYSAAQAVGGKNKSNALVIQAQAVAAMANSCGVSTFDRKCNYIYAAQLMEQAGRDGSKYRAAGPTKEDCFNNSNPTSVTLECWGVTVNPCK
ncbi:MAG: hypothetical protein Crog4KO_34130 [Crocinitomicaceae bacterium]